MIMTLGRRTRKCNQCCHSFLQARQHLEEKDQLLKHQEAGADVNPSVFAVRLHHTFGIFWHLSTIWSSWILLFDTLYLFSYCHLLFSFWREEPRHSCLLFDYQRLSWFFRSTSCITVRWSSESLSCLDLLPQWKVTISEAKPSCKGKFAPQSLIIMSGLTKAQQVGGWLESSWSLKHLEVFKWAKCI